MSNPGVETTWKTVFLGLGSNMGDRLDHLRLAVFALAVHPEIAVLDLSGIYETEYQGPGKQDPYLNACAKVTTSLGPEVLLAVLKGTEARHGRQPGSHLAPRPLDLDILLYDNDIKTSPRLSLPHPRLRERGFVLEPLAQIAADEKFPDSGETVGAACAKIRQKSGPWLKECRESSLLSGGTLRPQEDTTAASKEDWRAALAVHRR